MTIEEWLRIATKKLQAVGIGTARLDAVVIMEDVLRRDRAWLLAHPEHIVSSSEAARLTFLLNRRSNHEPLAYVRGKVEFYGRTFQITPDVLVPRPESETMIDHFKAIVVGIRNTSPKRKSQTKIHTPLRVADIGTGSGALGITAALEAPEAIVDLIDIDKNCLDCAKSNVDLFTLPCHVLLSDLLSETVDTYDIVLANLPYVPDTLTLNQAAMNEPKLAIFGGPDGLDVYRRLFKMMSVRKNHPLYFLTESFPSQHRQLRTIAASSGFAEAVEDDFIQVFRRIQATA